MEEFKGTPGPWHIKPVKAATVEGDLNIIQTGSATGKGYHIGYATTWTDSEETKNEAMANARLIAAAPELLEALQTYMSAVKRMNEAMSDGCNVQGAILALIGSEDMANAAIAKALGKE